MNAGIDRSRRRLLLTAGSVSLMLVSGCLGDDAPDPIELDDKQSCDQCGMMIEAQPGTAGQTYFDDDHPPDRDGPAWFCSGTCTYTYTLDSEEEGHDVTAIYLTDYSGVNWELSSENGTTVLSSHLEASAFAAAEELTMVAGSDVLAAMGPDLIPFSEEDDAESFRSERGGDLVSHDDVDRELLAALMA